ncbi:MAG: thiamine pyrophosphate-binding protein [Chloroflexi bacterium RBG_19FT_COMBO_47_9]|nr:MAG: thiamine pyrophosphate-binding protein [Chloroflexi bacterium RBG_19FT_COMBO_47_9]
MTQGRIQRASVVARLGSLTTAIEQGVLPKRLGLTLSEAIVLGLLQQGVKVFFSVFGHGSTEVGEVLRIYQRAGLVKVIGVRNEIEASHAATALRWVSGEKAAVVTSIGPGALQALAASIVPASDGIGIWYLFGDETTEDEGFNMQQVPMHEQSLFLRLAATMGRAYTLHTPAALPTALRLGATTVDHPSRPGPYYLLMPMNTQPAWMPDFNLSELPDTHPSTLGAAEGDYSQAADWIREAKRIVIKVGGGGRAAGSKLISLMERAAGVLVHTPIATGCVPYRHPQNMSVGGSKGTLCGNYATENADLLIAVGTRAVCQSDCSRTGYPNVTRVINLNADWDDATHYNHTLAFVGDIRLTLEKLNRAIGSPGMDKSEWLQACAEKKTAWQEYKLLRNKTPVMADDYWGGQVLTQPAAIKIATDWAKNHKAVCFFDAGDVQANGFQIVEDETPDQTFTETGASFMGFAVSALLSTAVASNPFYGLALTGDGSFSMNPQILIDGVEHGARGCILVLDNGRMGAITGLQEAQYGVGFATWNTLKVDYLTWAGSIPGLLTLDGGRTPEQLLKALDQAGRHTGLSLIHLPVYYGSHELGGMGVFGRWNVDNWVEETQALRHEIGL